MIFLHASWKDVTLLLCLLCTMSKASNVANVNEESQLKGSRQ